MQEYLFKALMIDATKRWNHLDLQLNIISLGSLSRLSAPWAAYNIKIIALKKNYCSLMIYENYFIQFNLIVMIHWTKHLIVMVPRTLLQLWKPKWVLVGMESWIGLYVTAGTHGLFSSLLGGCAGLEQDLWGLLLSAGLPETPTISLLWSELASIFRMKNKWIPITTEWFGALGRPTESVSDAVPSPMWPPLVY